MKRNADPQRIVYSTGLGGICPGCRRPLAGCACGDRKTARPDSSVVRVGRETQGRRGKGVTVITGAPLGLGELEQLGAQLKKLCGSGGTVREGVIEIQGDHRDRVVAELQKRGWTVKRSGG